MLMLSSRNELSSTKSSTEIKSIITSVVDRFILHSPCTPGGRFLMPLLQKQNESNGNNNEKDNESSNDRKTNEYIILSRRAAVNWVYRELQDIIIMISKNTNNTNYNHCPSQPQPSCSSSSPESSIMIINEKDSPATRKAIKSSVAVSNNNSFVQKLEEKEEEEKAIMLNSKDNNNSNNDDYISHPVAISTTSPTIDSYETPMTTRMMEIDESVENILVRQNKFS